MDGSLEKDLVFSSQWHVLEAHVHMYTLGVWNVEYDGGWMALLEKDLVCSSQWHVSEAHVYTLGVWNMMRVDGSLEKDLVFSSQWHVLEVHVYTLGVWNMMEGGWLFRE